MHNVQVVCHHTNIFRCIRFESAKNDNHRKSWKKNPPFFEPTIRWQVRERLREKSDSSSSFWHRESSAKIMIILRQSPYSFRLFNEREQLHQKYAIRFADFYDFDVNRFVSNPAAKRFCFWVERFRKILLLDYSVWIISGGFIAGIFRKTSATLVARVGVWQIFSYGIFHK